MLSSISSCCAWTESVTDSKSAYCRFLAAYLAGLKSLSKAKFLAASKGTYELLVTENWANFNHKIKSYDQMKLAHSTNLLLISTKDILQDPQMQAQIVKRNDQISYLNTSRTWSNGKIPNPNSFWPFFTLNQTPLYRFALGLISDF